MNKVTKESIEAFNSLNLEIKHRKVKMLRDGEFVDAEVIDKTIGGIPVQSNFIIVDNQIFRLMTDMATLYEKRLKHWYWCAWYWILEKYWGIIYRVRMMYWKYNESV